MINSQSTITLRLPYSDDIAQLPQRITLYSEGILIPAVFNRVLQLQKVITLRNKYLKTSVLRFRTLFTEKKSNKNRS